MKTIDDLKRAEKGLETFAAQQKKIIERLSAEVDRLWSAGGRAGHPLYETAYNKLDNARAIEKKYLEKYRGEVAAIKAELERQEQEADKKASIIAEQAESLEKAKARKTWLLASGSPAQFEASWPQIYEQLLIDKTVRGIEAEQSSQSGKIVL